VLLRLGPRPRGPRCGARVQGPGARMWPGMPWAWSHSPSSAVRRELESLASAQSRQLPLVPLSSYLPTSLMSLPNSFTPVGAAPRPRLWLPWSRFVNRGRRRPRPGQSRRIFEVNRLRHDREGQWECRSTTPSSGAAPSLECRGADHFAPRSGLPRGIGPGVNGSRQATQV
jgi:hypothetical protein